MDLRCEPFWEPALASLYATEGGKGASRARLASHTCSPTLSRNNSDLLIDSYARI